MTPWSSGCVITTNRLILLHLNGITDLVPTDLSCLNVDFEYTLPTNLITDQLASSTFILVHVSVDVGPWRELGSIEISLSAVRPGATFRLNLT